MGRRLIAQFLLLNLIVVAVAAVPAAGVIATVARSEAVDMTAAVARSAAASTVMPLCTRGLLGGDAGTLAALDRAVRSQIRVGAMSRVKVWTPEGRILYSDAGPLIGRSFPLAAEEKALLGTDRTRAQISTLKHAENTLEAQQGQLVEAYVGIRDAEGRPLLFEAYFPVATLNAGARLNPWHLVPLAMIGGLLLLLLQMPVSLVMGRRLHRAHNRHARLLANAAVACDLERRRVAGNLRGRVIQDLAGVAYLLHFLQLSRPAGTGDRGGDGVADAAERAGRIVADDVRLLQRTVADLDVPNLFQGGLDTCVHDLAEPLRQAGARCDVWVSDTSRLPELTVRLLYRAARELLRGVAARPGVTRVRVRLQASGQWAEFTVTDDGGAAPAEPLGMYLLTEALRDAGGALTVTAAPAGGTTVRVTLGRRQRRAPAWLVARARAARASLRRPRR
jgi:signal transduction histidine kinase